MFAILRTCSIVIFPTVFLSPVPFSMPISLMIRAGGGRRSDFDSGGSGFDYDFDGNLHSVRSLVCSLILASTLGYIYPVWSQGQAMVVPRWPFRQGPMLLRH